MSSQWYYSLFGEEFGPVDEVQLRELRDSGTIGPTDEVRREGESQPRPLSQAFEAPPSIVVSAVVSAASVDAVETGVAEEASWFYELLGQDMGPLTFDQLQELASHGNLRADDQVKFGTDGKYRRVGSIGRLVAVLPYLDSTTVIAAPPVLTETPPAESAVAATSDSEPVAGLLQSDFDALTVSSPPSATGRLVRAPAEPMSSAAAAVSDPPAEIKSQPPGPSQPTSKVAAVAPPVVPPPSRPASPSSSAPASSAPGPASSAPAPVRPVAPTPASGSSPYGSSAAASYGSMSAPKPPPPTPAKPSAKRRSSGGGFSFNLENLTGGSVNVPGLVALFVLGLVCLWLFMPEGSGPDRARLDSVQKIFEELKSNRDNKVPAAQWDQFVLSSRVTLAELKQGLRGKSNAGHPYRRHISWAVDLMPKVLESGREKVSPLEAQVQYDLKKARFLMKRGPDPDLELPAPAATETGAAPK